MVNALIYTRVSTDKQEYERQIYELKQVAEKENYNVINVYSEKISGGKKSNERDGFNELKTFIETSNQNIHIILTWEISRFGRSFIDAINTVYYFINRNINVYTHKEKLYAFDNNGNLNSGFNVMLSLLADFAEKERETMKARSKSGLKYRVYNNGANNGVSGGVHVPYGYNNTNKVLTINEYESKIIKQIFKQYNEGIGTINIAKYLNSNKIPTKTKNQYNWSMQTLYAIIKNPIYKGLRRYNNDYLKAPSLKIVSENVWDKANKRLSEKTNQKHINQTYINPLQDIIFCGKCEFKYTSYIHKTRRQYAYICNSKQYKYRGVKCDNVGVNIPFLNSLVYEHIRNHQMQIKDVNKQLQDVNQQINNLNILINNQKNDLKNIEKQEINLLDLRLNDSVSLDLYNNKLAEIKKNRDKTETELNNNNKKLTELKDFRKKIKNSKSIKLNVNTFKDNIKQLVKRIEIKKFEGEING
ncbi:MAG: recombinase family protein, partial [Marinilabiliaceae bacterium]